MLGLIWPNLLNIDNVLIKFVGRSGLSVRI